MTMLLFVVAATALVVVGFAIILTVLTLARLLYIEIVERLDRRRQVTIAPSPVLADDYEPPAPVAPVKVRRLSDPLLDVTGEFHAIVATNYGGPRAPMRVEVPLAPRRAYSPPPSRPYIQGELEITT